MGMPAGPVSTAAHPVVSGTRAKIIHGVAYAPALAPAAVQRAIWAGNQIRTKPYVYGGGHASFNDRGYDCSGSVSYVLHAAGLLRTPYDSSDFMHWGHGGLGQWITVYTNPGHAFVQIAGGIPSRSANSGEMSGSRRRSGSIPGRNWSANQAMIGPERTRLRSPHRRWLGVIDRSKAPY